MSYIISYNIVHMMIFDGEIQIRVSKQNVAFESKFKGLMYYDHNDSSLSPKWCKGLFTTVTFRRCCRYCEMKKCVKYNFEAKPSTIFWLSFQAPSYYEVGNVLWCLVGTCGLSISLRTVLGRAWFLAQNWSFTKFRFILKRTDCYRAVT